MPALSPGDAVDVVANVRAGGEGRELLAHPDVERDGLYDLWLRGGAIADIAPAGYLRRTGAVLDAGGAWVVPGLWDHHVHTVQWALAQGRVSLENAATSASAAALAATGPLRHDGCRVGMQYRDALWPDEPSLAVLDAATGEVPTYLINADLHSMWLNSAALRREQLRSDDGSGIVREEHAFRISARLGDLAPDALDSALDGALAQASARGVVGFEDFEVGWNLDRWRRRVANGHDQARVRFVVYPSDLERASAEGFVTS
ncbi:MAG: amidohydrolase family protein, partial [Microbacterium sp.]